jgi:glycosyltransferase involved in cell wall biosynthesis
VYDFAKEWVRQGHEVTVVTCLYAKSDLKATKWVETQFFDGIRVKVLNIRIDNKQSFWKRVLSFIQYSVMASWFALTAGADVVIASSGPITAGLPGLIARYVRGSKMVFEVRDLWPQGAVELGVIRNRLVIRAAYAFEHWCYRAASLVVTLSTGMQKNIEDRFGIDYVISVPNAANLDMFADCKSVEQLPDYFKEKKVAIYAGNIGAVNNSMLILNTARLLRQRQRFDILLLLIGDGQQKEAILQAKQLEKLDNLVLLPLIAKTDLVPYLRHSMVSLVPLRDTPILSTSSPNKLFESLAASVPVIQTTHGWIADLLDRYKCGLTIDASKPEALVDALIYLADNPSDVACMGQAGRRAAEKLFGKDLLARQMLTSLVLLSHSK